MNDPTSVPPPADKDHQDKKSSAPSAPAASEKGDQLPKSKANTFTQQLFIWSLVIIVGALFGMQGSLAVIQQGGRVTPSGISEAQIISYQSVDQRLQKVLGPYVARTMSYDEYSQRIKIANQAAAEGLMPAGAALDKVVEEYLDREIGPGKTIRSALSDYKGGPNEVTRVDLQRRLALDQAGMAYFHRHVVSPAVPLAVADALVSLRQDKIQVDQVDLDAGRFVKPVPDDDPEIVQTYEKLRQERFRKPESARLTVAYADIEALKKETTVSDDDAKAWYEKNKTLPEFQKPGDANAKPPTPSAPKEYSDEIKAIAVERLKTERAQAAAKKKADDFDAELEANAGAYENQKDSRSFIAGAQKFGLVTKEVTVEPKDDPQSGGRTLDLAEVGRMRDQAGIFAQGTEPGFVSRAVPIDEPKSAAVLRLESRTKADFRKPDEPEVREAVKKYLAGQRAYKDFIKAAQEAREAAQKMGLAIYLTSPEGMKWNQKTTSSTLTPDQVLRTPPPELGQASTESRVAMSLAMPERPICLAESDNPSTDLPRARLIQARASDAYQAAPAGTDVAQRREEADSYRQQLSSYRWALFEPEYTRIQNQK